MIPKNGIYIIQGEVNHIVAALRRNNRWNGGQFRQEEEEPLLSSFTQLKDTLQNTNDANELDVNIFLGPFLEVIRSEDTTGPITGVALSSVNKFLSYGLLDPSSESVGSGIENLADAVTHARFVGTDPNSDEVVLMKILQVLRTLLLSPVGVHMTNEAVCEIMQSCFRICFEMRLSELLRRTAEQTLIDMVQLLFLRLPQFKEDLKENFSSPHIRKMFKRTGPLASTRKGWKKAKQQKAGSKSRRSTRSPDLPSTNNVKSTSESEKSPEEPNEPREGKNAKPLQDTVPGNIPGDAEIASTHHQTNLSCGIVETNTNNSTNEDGISETEPSTRLADFNPEIMKSIDEGIDILGEETDGSNEKVNVQGDSVPSPDSSLQGGDSLSQEEDKEEDENKNESETNMENFKDHGVISLHYPEEDQRSLDSLDVNDQTKGSVETKAGDEDGAVGEPSDVNNEYVNQQGVRFTPQEDSNEGHVPLVPYGLPCVRELLRFLTTLINPNDRQNTNTMIHIGLSLLTVALESGATNLSHFASLMELMKDDVCKNIFALMQCDIHVLFSLSMRVSFLLFEALRGNLKFQLEKFFTKIIETLSLENLNIPYEKREMALEYMNQIFHVPCLVQEVYVNFDCDLHSSNMLEDLCKTLSKNAFRPGNLSSVNLLALDALLTVVNEIEDHCAKQSSPNQKQCDGKQNKERTSSSSSEITAEESEVDDMDQFVGHIAFSTSGYAVGKRLLNLGLYGMDKEKAAITQKESNPASFHGVPLPSAEEIIARKRKKKLLMHGIEEFNKKPKKGIEYMQENNLMSNPFEPNELIHFMKENPNVDKKTIGEYIGDRKNGKVLEAFVNSFELKNVRIDEALRSFLETFRLPGESPVISHILEDFSERYFANNPHPYKNTDAAFTLAYAVIMLNVDQHNKNVKQQKSMTFDEYKVNLRQTNGGEDFPVELLQEIYDNIRTNEIVMPSERSGKVKEQYEWKVLIRKCNGPDAVYIPVNSSLYDEELFLVIWGPTVAALSYIYDNSMDKNNIQKSILGFRKCATISAYYSLSEVFDNILISLCKFTSLLVTGETSDNLPVLFGSNAKAQLSARTAFALAHKLGDNLREGWQNLLVCILQLLKGKLLPVSLTEIEDFVEGKISLLKEEPQPAPKQDSTGIFGAFYAYMIANPDPSNKSNLSVEDRKAQETAIKCISDCDPKRIQSDSKFLRPESLQELVKALIIYSKPEHSHESTDVPYDAEASVFFLEFLIEVALHNRDRISLMWQSLREHLSNIIIGAPKVSFHVERAVVGLLRLAIRLIRREDISAQILITLRVLLMMHPKVLLSCSKQISYGLHELIRTNASDIHYSRDWITILTILQVVGAGANPPIVKPGPSLTLIAGDIVNPTEEKIDTETGEVYQTAEQIDRGDTQGENENKVGEQWLLINKNEDEDLPVNQFDLTFKEKLHKHDCKVFIKASSSIGFIVRDLGHVRDFNIFQCIYAVLLFGEASSNGGVKYQLEDKVINQLEMERRLPPPPKKPGKASKGRRLPSPTMDRRERKKKSFDLSRQEHSRSEDEIEFNENTGNIYDAISLQLLDLMYLLHTNASQILGNLTWQDYSERQTAEMKARWSSKESIDQLPSTFRGDVDNEMSLLWVKCWCPLLQGIGRLACDTRRHIRMASLTVLQRALLARDLHSLVATEWENCFNQVLFPMLSSLLEIPADIDPIGLEETRMRAATLLCKGFLQHLNTLLTLATFTALWMTILDFMDKYMHADNSDLLFEAIPESLKNMLLVMSTAGIFEQHTDAKGEEIKQPSLDNRQYSALWQVTWERIDCFLPNLKNDLIATQSPVTLRVTSPPHPDVPAPMTMHDKNDVIAQPQRTIEQPQKEISSTENQPAEMARATTPTPSSISSTPVKQQEQPMSPERAASPLLTEDPLSHLNIKLHAPLPHISPPGNIHAIHQPVHPIPILLPPLSVPGLGGVMNEKQPGNEVNPGKTDTGSQLNTTVDENEKESSVLSDKNSSIVYDI